MLTRRELRPRTQRWISRLPGFTRGFTGDYIYCDDEMIELAPVSQEEYCMRRAEPQDIEIVAQIFLASFNQSIGKIMGRLPKAEAVKDIFSFAQEVLQDEFQVAVSEGKVAGYILIPHQTSKLWRQAVASGDLFRWFYRWVRGRYGFGLPAFLRIAWNKIVFFALGLSSPDRSEARILSLAVAPWARGKGIGKALLEKGLSILASRGVKDVRLEVRADNVPALSLYRNFGFQEIGSVNDTGGKWLRLEKSLSRNEPTSSSVIG